MWWFGVLVVDFLQATVVLVDFPADRLYFTLMYHIMLLWVEQVLVELVAVDQELNILQTPMWLLSRVVVAVVEAHKVVLVVAQSLKMERAQMAEVHIQLLAQDHLKLVVQQPVFSDLVSEDLEQVLAVADCMVVVQPQRVVVVEEDIWNLISYLSQTHKQVLMPHRQSRHILVDRLVVMGELLPQRQRVMD
jgi:hypothetical protein